MSKQKPKSPPPPTVNEILAMGTGELSKLSEKEMRKLVNVLVSAGNKRIRRLKNNVKKGIATEALNGVMETGGVFSARGKNRNQLFREIVRARNFFESPLSTVTGAMEERKRRERALFGETREERARRLKQEEKKKEQERKRLERERRKAEKKGKKKKSSKPQEAKAQEAETQEAEAQEAEPDPYDTDEWNPEEQLKETFKAFRMFKRAYPALMKAAQIDSDTLLQMMGSFTMAGMSAETAVQAAYNDLMAQYEDLEKARQEAERWEWTDV